MHLFAVMSPGPDFILIAKQSLCHGRIISLYTSLGIGFGIIIHILFSVFGLGLIIYESKFIFNFITILGSFYLTYLGLQALMIKTSFRISDRNADINDFISFKAFKIGFITNILNPKATLFFLSLYTFILSTNPPIYIQLIYGFWMSIITVLWFSFLSIVLTNKKTAYTFRNFGVRIQKIMGFMLAGIGIKMLFDILLKLLY